jgi:hypothetical protein
MSTLLVQETAKPEAGRAPVRHPGAVGRELLGVARFLVDLEAIKVWGTSIVPTWQEAPRGDGAPSPDHKAA